MANRKRNHKRNHKREIQNREIQNREIQTKHTLSVNEHDGMEILNSSFNIVNKSLNELNLGFKMMDDGIEKLRLELNVFNEEIEKFRSDLGIDDDVSIELVEPVGPVEPVGSDEKNDQVVPQNIVKDASKPMDRNYTDEEYWGKFITNVDGTKKLVEYLLNEFGTKEACNRFDVGNSIEFILIDSIVKSGFEVTEMPNEKRFDLNVKNYKKLSIKYSSCGDITLHNSNSCVNKDEEMKDTILLTGDKLYLITMDELKKNNIDVKPFIKNAGDSLKLKRSLLKELERKKYPYVHNINIKYNKTECKHRLCSKVFYKKLVEEYESLNK
jgi:hypothetical protein